MNIMSNEATAKGTFLTVGIACMTAGSAVIAANFVLGLGLIGVGAALIFLREWIKEN